MKDRTRVHYERFHNIFLYVTERCQLRCGHCYMGERLERGLMLSLANAQWIIESCRRLGAKYITLLGGEPTLHPELPKIVAWCQDRGYQQVMLDTNGLRAKPLFAIPPESLYYVTISLDGATVASHEKVRGPNTFQRTLDTIRVLVLRGYRVRINSTVCQFNTSEGPQILELAEQLGVKLVNFHAFSEEGLGIGKGWSLTPDKWIAFYESLERIKGQFSVSVWFPPTWARRSDLERFEAQGFGGCLGCSLDRLSIFPDGRCYLCSVLFDRAVHFATITRDGLALNREQNEYDAFARAAFVAEKPSLMGCPAERVLQDQGMPTVPSELVSMCRCWKSQV